MGLEYSQIFQDWRESWVGMTHYAIRIHSSFRLVDGLSIGLSTINECMIRLDECSCLWRCSGYTKLIGILGSVHRYRPLSECRQTRYAQLFEFSRPCGPLPNFGLEPYFYITVLASCALRRGIELSALVGINLDYDPTLKTGFVCCVKLTSSRGSIRREAGIDWLYNLGYVDNGQFGWKSYDFWIWMIESCYGSCCGYYTALWFGYDQCHGLNQKGSYRY